MKRTLRTLGTLLLGAVVYAAVAGVTPARAFDGELLDTVRVILPDSVITRLEGSLPGMRTIIATVDVWKITYRSDSLRVKGYLAVPKSGGRLPCVIDNRGGNRDYSQWTDARAISRLGRIAAWGYVVVASQYRGVDGGDGVEEFGGRDVNDVLNLIPLLATHPRADTTRIGMYGWSRGGMMTYLALTRTDRIRAAIIGAGMADLSDMIRRRPEMETEVVAQLVPGFATRRDEALAERSAVRWPERLAPATPILLLQGSADWRVDPGQALTMTARLYALRRPVRLVFFEGGDHGLTEFQAEVDRLTHDWLDRYVRDRTAWPSLEPHGR